MAELTFIIEGTVTADFTPDAGLLGLVGDVLEAYPGIVDPVMTAEPPAGLLHISVEVTAPDRRTALDTFRDALAAAMIWELTPTPEPVP